jgi:hypothetical protein
LAEPLKRGDLYFVKPPGFVGKGAQLEAISASLRDWLDL